MSPFGWLASAHPVWPLFVLPMVVVVVVLVVVVFVLLMSRGWCLSLLVCRPDPKSSLGGTKLCGRNAGAVRLPLLPATGRPQSMLHVVDGCTDKQVVVVVATMVMTFYE